MNLKERHVCKSIDTYYKYKITKSEVIKEKIILKKEKPTVCLSVWVLALAEDRDVRNAEKMSMWG